MSVQIPRQEQGGRYACVDDIAFLLIWKHGHRQKQHPQSKGRDAIAQIKSDTSSKKYVETICLYDVEFNAIRLDPLFGEHVI